MDTESSIARIPSTAAWSAAILSPRPTQAPAPSSPGVPEDARDARMRVLHVVDRILLRALGCEVDVDVDRLVVPTGDQVPARSIDADLLHQLVQKDDIPAALRDLLRQTAFDDVDELIDQHLDP